MFNWLKIVYKYKKEILSDLKELLEINSEKKDIVKNKFPFGKGPAIALKKVLFYGKRDGFKIKNFDNYIGHIEYGNCKNKKNIIGILVHIDVVPAGNGWVTDPYKMIIKNNKIFSRGIIDDKGPTIAVYYAIKIIKDLNIKLFKKIRLIIGTDEENNWDDIKYYLKFEKIPKVGFSPDAEFPFIYGEKGNIMKKICFNNGLNGKKCILKLFISGIKNNIVPDKAEVILLVNEIKLLNNINYKFNLFIKKYSILGKINIFNKNYIKILIFGISSHGSLPQLGKNAATFMALFLYNFPFKYTSKKFIKVIKDLHNDIFCNKLGFFKKDYNKKITMNVCKVIFKDGILIKNNSIFINFRYPLNFNIKKINIKFKERINNCKIISFNNLKPYYIKKSFLTNVLLKVYKKYTFPFHYYKKKIIGGSTYARLFKNGIAFGPLFPWSKNVIHKSNEFFKINDFFKIIAIYSNVIYLLTRKK